MSLETLGSGHPPAAVLRCSLAVAVLLAWAGTAPAQTPFGQNGMLTIPFENAADAAGFGISVADPSRILLSANVGERQPGIDGDQLGLSQLTREGERDPVFGNNGEVITDFEVFGALGGFVAPHDDGHLALAGSPAAAMGVTRFDAAGAKDAGFGADAKVMLDFPDDVSSATGRASSSTTPPWRSCMRRPSSIMPR